MKPVALVERAIRNSSKSRDIVLDPFGGSGSTLIACEKTGRQARLMELDPRYCDVIVRRWQEWAAARRCWTGTGEALKRSLLKSRAFFFSAVAKGLKAGRRQPDLREVGQQARKKNETAECCEAA